jgi:hypothetical protein
MSLTLECDAYRKRAQEKLYLVAEIRSELNFDQTIGDCPTVWTSSQLAETDKAGINRLDPNSLPQFAMPNLQSDALTSRFRPHRCVLTQIT